MILDLHEKGVTLNRHRVTPVYLRLFTLFTFTSLFTHGLMFTFHPSQYIVVIISMGKDLYKRENVRYRGVYLLSGNTYINVLLIHKHKFVN